MYLCISISIRSSAARDDGRSNDRRRQRRQRPAQPPARLAGPPSGIPAPTGIAAAAGTRLDLCLVAVGEVGLGGARVELNV